MLQHGDVGQRTSGSITMCPARCRWPCGRPVCCPAYCPGITGSRRSWPPVNNRESPTRLPAPARHYGMVVRRPDQTRRRALPPILCWPPMSPRAPDNRWRCIRPLLGVLHADEGGCPSIPGGWLMHKPQHARALAKFLAPALQNAPDVNAEPDSPDSCTCHEKAADPAEPAVDFAIYLELHEAWGKGNPNGNGTAEQDIGKLTERLAELLEDDDHALGVLSALVAAMVSREPMPGNSRLPVHPADGGCPATAADPACRPKR